MQNAADLDVLDSVAGSISDGAQVPWEDVAQQVGASGDAAVMDQLRELERIAKFYRETEEPHPDGVADAEKEWSGPRNWGHFLILGRLGHGASGEVYRAHDAKLQCEVALKLIPDDGTNPANISRVLKEARLLARVRHTNVVSIYGADHLDGHVGLWMELVRGTTLEDLLLRQGPFGAREASLIGLDLCRAIAAVHRAGLLHGDIKAHNVMREEGGRTVLMDFGVGRDLDQELPHEHVGESADFAGTPLYLAPEVFAGSRRTKVADVYSIGVLLFHLVSHRYPVEGETGAAIEEAHRRKTRTHLRDLRADLPEEFVNLVERALDADPSQRFQSAGAFEIALAKSLGTAAENGHLERWRPRSIALATGAAALVVAPIYWLSMHPQVAPAASPLAAVASAAPVTALPGSYSVDASLYRISGTGEAKLAAGDRIKPGDRLTMQIQVSQPAHVYVVNEDDNGESYLLFPLPNQTVTNPVPAGYPVRLPAGGDSPLYWTVTSAGGREHFLIFATPEPLPAFDRMFAALPRPQLNAPVLASRLTAETVGGVLRGVGGLTNSSRAIGSKLTEQFTTPLRQTAETVNGMWVRQITLENPR